MKMKKAILVIAAILLINVNAVTAHADFFPQETEYAEGELLVLMEETPASSRKNSFSGNTDTGMEIEFEITPLMTVENSDTDTEFTQAVVRNSFGSTETGDVIALVKSETATTEELMEAVEKMPQVKGYARNYANYSHAAGTSNPSDSLWSQQWGAKLIGAQQVWQSNTGSEEVIVAVIDTGIMYDHEDIKSNIYTFSSSFGTDLAGKHGFWYYYDNGKKEVEIGGGPTTGFSWSNADQIGDVDGHGTHVAGIIGATANNGAGVAGIAWNNVKLLAFNVYSPSYTGSSVSGFPIAYDSDVIKAINQIIKLKSEHNMNIRVANLSFGSWRQAVDQTKDPFGQAIKKLSDAGVVVVMSAGNENENIDSPSSKYTGQKPYPAAYKFDNTITVGAVQQSAGSTNYRATYSNYSSTGNFVDVFAPGSNIVSTVRYTPVVGATSERFSNTGYLSMNGTSMAAPMVSGTVALMSSIFPAKSASEIKALVMSGCNGSMAKSGVSKYGTISALSSYSIGSGIATETIVGTTPVVGGTTPNPDRTGTESGSGEGGGGGGCSATGSFLLLLPILAVPFVSKGLRNRKAA